MEVVKNFVRKLEVEAEQRKQLASNGNRHERRKQEVEDRELRKNNG